MNLLLPPLWPIIAAATEVETEAGPLILAGVLLSLVVIYFASKLGGEVCLRLNLPPVLGELVGGVVIGISVFKLLLFSEGGLSAEDSLVMQLLLKSTDLSPEGAQSVFAAQSEVISVISELGVIILLFEIGLESNLKELIRVGPQAAIVAVVGVITPFSLGTIGLIYLFGVAPIPAIFAGAALTATSIGITAKVLAEINRLSSNEGQIIIGAAVLDDILGIIVLAVVGSLVKTGEIQISNVVYLMVSATAFVVGSILIGRFLSSFYVSLVNRMKTRGQLLLVSLCIAFILSFIAQIVQLEAILGSFAAGLILAETEKREDLEKQILPIADFFVPVFFVCVGAKTNIGVLNPAIPANREGLIIAAFLIVVAIIGKVVTGFTLFGNSDLNKWAIGVGMIPRGEVGLVFAGVGAASGALDPATDAAIIVMVIVTTYVAPPWLRLVFQQKDQELTPAITKEEPEILK
jgi:Kef-type K+ transport system membrane component KefB